MSSIDWLPLISYILITIFSPGPNGLIAMSISLAHGYKQSSRFCAGVGVGYIIIMFAAAFISNLLLRFLPSFELVLRIVGSLYIAWLALLTLRKNFDMQVQGQSPHGFWYGFFFQLINIKGVLFGLTLFATFLSPLRAHFAWLAVSALILALLAFLATSMYALFGASIRRYLSNPLVRRVVSITLSLLLLFIALSVSGLIDWVALKLAS